MDDIQFVPSYEDVPDISKPYARALKDFRFTVRHMVVASPEGGELKAQRILEQAWRVYVGGVTDRLIWREVELVTGE